ncbi:MAG: hypothetical protein WAZ18_03775 [Alphaproteobacteria bacterium]
MEQDDRLDIWACTAEGKEYLEAQTYRGWSLGERYRNLEQLQILFGWNNAKMEAAKEKFRFEWCLDNEFSAVRDLMANRSSTMHSRLIRRFHDE